MELEATNHIIRNISRHVAEELPFLSIMFITHEPGASEKGLEKKRFDLEHHIAGSIFMARLQELAKQRDMDIASVADFAGIAMTRDKKILSFLEKYYALACFFVDVSAFEDEYQLRQYAHAQIYRVLNVINTDGKLGAFKKKHNGLYKAEQSPDDVLADNIYGDVFAAIMTRLEGQNNGLIKMAKYRAMQSLVPRAKHRPEMYPFPLIYDLTKLVLKEQESKIEHNISLGNRNYLTALELTRDIIEAFDIKTTGSWKNFCEAAQEMAWGEADPRKILGTAIYSCEDPFIRSDAYLVCDILAMEPLLVTVFDFYNPFTDDEVNERRHQKYCAEVLEGLMIQIGRPSASKNFLKKAAEQSALFLKGHILGWCAPALMAAAQILDTDLDLHSADKVKEVFNAKMNEIPWISIKSAGIELINRRQAGLDVSDVVTILADNPDWDLIREPLSHHEKSHL